MKILLAGQKYFGLLALREILGAGYSVDYVCAPVEHKDGRRDRLYNDATLRGIPVIQGGTLNGATMPVGVDLIICAHSYDFISGKVRNKSALGAIGFHPSLLPLHRGRDAIRWAVKMGDRVTGGTVFWLDNNVDAGPIAAQDYCFIRPGDDAEKLWRRDLQPMGVRLTLSTLADIKRGIIRRVPQDDALATWEPSWERAPIYRPDLPQIGPGLENYKIITERVLAQ